MRRASRTGVRLRAPGAGKPDSAGAAREREIALSAASPWRYPRNRAGRGYLVEDPFRELRAARAAESGRPARPARTGAPRRRRSGALAAAAAARFFSLARARRVSAARLVRGDAHVGRRRARSARVDLSGGAFRLRHPRALSTGRKHRGAVRPPGAERRLPRPPPFQAPRQRAVHPDSPASASSGVKLPAPRGATAAVRRRSRRWPHGAARTLGHRADRTGPRSRIARLVRSHAGASPLPGARARSDAVSGTLVTTMTSPFGVGALEEPC